MTIAQKLQPYAWPAYLVALFSVALATLYVLLLMHGPHAHTPAAAVSGNQPECRVTGMTIPVAITGVSNPAIISAKRCDILIFSNGSSKHVDIAFGPHEEHYPYPGLTSDPLKPGQSSSLVLTKTGSYPIHEHITDVLIARITINN